MSNNGSVIRAEVVFCGAPFNGKYPKKGDYTSMKVIFQALEGGERYVLNLDDSTPESWDRWLPYTTIGWVLDVSIVNYRNKWYVDKFGPFNPVTNHQQELISKENK